MEKWHQNAVRSPGFSVSVHLPIAQRVIGHCFLSLYKHDALWMPADGLAHGKWCVFLRLFPQSAQMQCV